MKTPTDRGVRLYHPRHRHHHDDDADDAYAQTRHHDDVDDADHDASPCCDDALSCAETL